MKKTLGILFICLTCVACSPNIKGTIPFDTMLQDTLDEELVSQSFEDLLTEMEAESDILDFDAYSEDITMEDLETVSAGYIVANEYGIADNIGYSYVSDYVEDEVITADIFRLQSQRYFSLEIIEEPTMKPFNGINTSQIVPALLYEFKTEDDTIKEILLFLDANETWVVFDFGMLMNIK